MNAMITAMTYCDNLNMLSIGLSNGMIVSYTMEIESFVYTSSNAKNVQNVSRPPKQAPRQLLQSAGNELSSVDFIQSEEGTPELDMEAGRFSEVGESTMEESKGPAAASLSENSGLWLKKFKLISHSCDKIHSYVKSMIVD